MTFKLALSYLSSLNESRIKPGLERINEALSALGNPQSHFPHILIGGTNGKGSVVSFTGGALHRSGYRTGLFTSPHLIDFRERIAVGDHPLKEDELVALVTSVRETGIELTYFEFTVAMAMLYFARQSVDVAVLEVGLGGAWDATNATDPILSVITSVDLDHKKWLGNTVEEVAREKSGIMRTGRPVVAGPMGSAARQVVLEQALATGARLILCGRDFCGTLAADDDALHYEGVRWNIKGIVPAMKGLFQLDNAACALAALEALKTCGFEIGRDIAVKGITTAKRPGRFQVVEGSPQIIIDAAHNPAAMSALTASLRNRKNVVWLYSALADKDFVNMTREMMGLSSRFVLVPVDHPRALRIQDMVSKMPEAAEFEVATSIEQGIAVGRDLTGSGGCIVVAGSVVLAGEVIRELGLTPQSEI